MPEWVVYYVIGPAIVLAGFAAVALIGWKVDRADPGDLWDRVRRGW